MITCCFDQHECIRDWAELQEHAVNVSRYLVILPPAQIHREYLKDPPAYLQTQLMPMGYKTCHILNNSLDASVCADDCKKWEKQKFAKKCAKDGGFFKCCIRRDAAFCHECRCDRLFGRS